MPDDGHLDVSLSRPTSAAVPATGARTRRWRRVLRNIVLAALALVAMVAAAKWGYFQWSHIVETDARIATNQIAISSRVSGWVTQMPVIEADAIATGALLIEIDTREATLQLAELDARLRTTNAERERMKAEMAMIDARTASRLTASRSRAEAALVGVEAGREQLDLASTEYQRIYELVVAAVVSQQRLDNVRVALSRAQERYQRALADLATAEADVGEATADRRQIGVTRQRMAALEGQEAQIAAQRQRQALDIADRVIHSPIDGVVSQTFVDFGEFIQPGQRLMLIHNPDRIWVEANIKETEIRHLATGMPVAVTVDAYPNRVFSGSIERIGQAATSEFTLLPNPNPSGNFTKVTQRLPVRIAIAQDRGLLRPGMMVVIDIAVSGR